MDNCIIYVAGYTPALDFCTRALKEEGFVIAAEPNTEVTHLLLPVPSFTPEGCIVGGGNLRTLLTLLPKDIVVIGGNLDCPELVDYRTVDLLQDAGYVAMNANITAHCAIKVALNNMDAILDGCEVLVVGWGRIGKCLAQLLRQMDAQVTVCARKESDRSMVRALGYTAVDYTSVNLQNYRVIYNTVPSMVFPDTPKDALKIDLASKLGLGGEDVIWARGLPGKKAPESSGALIARSIIPILREGSL